jgi:SNF2 family DNA or RNA helicase
VKQVFSKAAARGIVDKDIVFDSHGCILADDMGLGKTLTTLTTIQLSQKQAILFANEKLDQDAEIRTPATLIICPLSTLDNWINEINTHFDNGSLPYQVFYGKERSTIQFQDISRVAIVLATYESVCISGMKESTDGQQIETSDQGRKRKSGLNLSHFRWFRIVLDEAQ